MKKLLLLLVLSLFTSATMAQNGDSVRLVTAKRHELNLPKGASGYTVERVNLFNSVQTISVIKYSPKRLQTSIVQPEKLTRLSVTSKAHNADFSVNAGYWDVRISQPSTFLKLDGKQLAVTADFEKERVDGVVCLAKKRVIVDYCKAGEEAPYAAKYDNILASGPVLIDEGKSVDHTAYTKSMVEAKHGKDIGAYYTYIRRHPRTAIGTDKKGNVYLVVVDGRSKGNAAGVTIAELTEICEWLGMRDAINLDGGSSSTMWGEKDGVINYPCRNKKFDHAGERKVSSCVLVKSKKK
ncbi:MAG: phosphodiester glycosidase family protein [Rikenellaceae bacterium]|nr:phosphodiester glycosidase family protein [Rikenellaceae bacterium]